MRVVTPFRKQRSQLHFILQKQEGYAPSQPSSGYGAPAPAPSGPGDSYGAPAPSGQYGAPSGGGPY